MKYNRVVLQSTDEIISLPIRDKGDWASLPTEQRAERERNMQHMMLLARFHNMLGGHTIKTLIRLTREVKHTLIERE